MTKFHVGMETTRGFTILDLMTRNGHPVALVRDRDGEIGLYPCSEIGANMGERSGSQNSTPDGRVATPNTVHGDDTSR